MVLRNNIIMKTRAGIRRCGAQFGTISVVPGSQLTCTKVSRMIECLIVVVILVLLLLVVVVVVVVEVVVIVVVVVVTVVVVISVVVVPFSYLCFQK